MEKRMPNQSKVKRLMSNFIGASASVAVVTAVASITVSMEARFLKVDVLEDRAFYELEVIETLTVDGSTSLASSELVNPDPAAVQLRVESQWDNYVIALIYGFNEGVIQSLRPNQNYTLSIELEDTLGWRTLDTHTFSTRPRTNAVITSIIETTSPLSSITSFEAQVITQDGFTAADKWEVEFNYGDVTTTTTVGVGQETLTWMDLSHQNTDVEIRVFATINNDRRLISEKTQTTTPFIDGSIDLEFTTRTNLSIRPRFNHLSTPGTHAIKWMDINNHVQSFSITDEVLLIENLIENQLYQLQWIYTTEDERTFVVFEKSLTPIVQPYFVMHVKPLDVGFKFELTIDRMVSIEALYLSFGLFDSSSAHLFSPISENEGASYYELVLETGIPLGSSLTLILVQASPHNYPITFYSFNFQGGLTQ